MSGSGVPTVNVRLAVAEVCPPNAAVAVRVYVPGAQSSVASRKKIPPVAVSGTSGLFGILRLMAEPDQAVPLIRGRCPAGVSWGGLVNSGAGEATVMENLTLSPDH
ncbi:hypothetical protein D3C84_539950 [compost metagenome]